MKFLVKISLVCLVLVLVSAIDANAQEARRKVQKPEKTEKSDRSILKKSDAPSVHQASKKSESVSSSTKKQVTIWDVVPADGYVATGNVEQDKKSKMLAQRRWVKEHPEEFMTLMETHGIKPKKK